MRWEILVLPKPVGIGFQKSFCSDLVLLPVFCAALTTIHPQPPRSVNFCWYRFSVCHRPLYPDRDCSDFTVVRNVRKEAQSKQSPTCSVVFPTYIITGRFLGVLCYLVDQVFLSSPYSLVRTVNVLYTCSCLEQVPYWSRLPREPVEYPWLETLKTWWDRALNILL